ncbi:hypothetical protein GC101_26960 [Paenibacillus sp. LMG 31459]|uniref:Uncharacterized protein n=1 Tax=Paenibacillus phytohabitans TaxID=2654978 RepID=A0ABX1YN78_9BACL|nr:hypothetical protein [Paenibacillus phytohabitans]NOU82510.1 hypothetical protein [Paenibacillus phytohabitans]
MDQDQQEREDELLRASFMGDIREDVEFLGLSLKDIGWIVGTTLVIGGFPFLLPFPVLFKMTWIVATFMISTLGQWLKWPYRLKRYMHDAQQKKEGSGEDLGSFLGLEEDGWLYRSGKTLHVVSSLSASPWKTAVYAQKRTRIGGFEQFLRAMIQEGFSAQISAEQIPDVRRELWNQKRNRPSASQGIQNMKLNRIRMWEGLAQQGKALRSEYTLTLTTFESKIKVRERADEPADMNQEELKRFRLLSELQEKKDRVLNTLTAQGGHSTSLLSGFSLPEILGRWWDRTAWEDWKMNEGTWEEPSFIEEFAEEQPDPQEARSLFSPLLVKEILNKSRKEESEGVGNPVMENEAESTPLVIEEVISETRDFSMLKLRRGSIFKCLQMGNQGVRSLRTMWNKIALPLFSKWFRSFHLECQKFRTRKPGNSDNSVELTLEAIGGVDERKTILPQAEIQSKGLLGVVLLTSPIPSGKSFLVANLGVATSLSGTTVSIVDLSPDQGTRTLLNPLQQPSELDGWDIWSGKAADWLLFTPSRYPALLEVKQLLNNRVAEDGLVIAEIPWDYPDREALMQCYHSIVVLDVDYHHWLRFAEAAPNWEGEIWLNQSTPEMSHRMASLLKGKYQKVFAAVYPYFPAAALGLFQGRTLALDPDIRSLLNVHRNREETTHEPTQTYETVS